jgi:hypothetical protein
VVVEEVMVIPQVVQEVVQEVTEQQIVLLWHKKLLQ